MHMVKLSTWAQRTETKRVENVQRQSRFFNRERMCSSNQKQQLRREHNENRVSRRTHKTRRGHSPSIPLEHRIEDSPRSDHEDYVPPTQERVEKEQRKKDLPKRPPPPKASYTFGRYLNI